MLMASAPTDARAGPPKVATPSVPIPAIRVTGVGKTFATRHGPLEAVRDVSFNVERREFVAVLGPSGCGKSTLMMMCAGLDKPSRGEIAIDGAVLREPRTETGIMFQDPTLLPWLSVLDNVLIPITIARRPRAAFRDRAHELLSLVGLDGFETKKPHELSGGMRQRVAICRALIHDTDILLMDEPFSALDAITRDDMGDLLLEISQRYAKSALFITHSIREAVLLADRVLVMGRRPSVITEDLAIPFRRPRDRSVADTAEFITICAHLRAAVAQGSGR
jgi:NitT/TauT family transport system ATP-binding protein